MTDTHTTSEGTGIRGRMGAITRLYDDREGYWLRVVFLTDGAWAVPRR